MKHTLSVLLGVALLASLMFVPAAMPAQAYSTTYHFDQTLSPWLPGSDFGAFDKESLLHQPWGGSPTCSDDTEGYATLSDYFSPNKGEGSWMVTSIEVHGPTTVELTWSTVYKVQSPTWCGKGCDATVYVGATLPTDSSEFTVLGELPDNWKELFYRQSIAGSGTAYVAIGWRSHVPVNPGLYIDPIEDKEMIVNIDCVTVTARPITR